MLQTIELLPGVVLRCFPDDRFKQGCLSIQLVRQMCSEESGMNALIPAVLLRGSQRHTDMRAVTQRLDELYGASIGALVRRIGDRQTIGFYCAFMEDRFALEGDRVLAPMVEFAEELLLHPDLEEGCFRRDYVESEKKNLIATIESQRNDKRAYAAAEMMKKMCRGDSFGIPRLGEREQVAAVTPKALFDHYRRILQESPVELFYVGSAPAEEVAALLAPIFRDLDRVPLPLPPQTAFCDEGESDTVEEMDVAQARLCMGLLTPITIRDRAFAAMQVLNTVFGGGMTSKLFMNVRERLSLCYEIGSGFYGSKGILTVNAGVDGDKLTAVRDEIMAQLNACKTGDITTGELTAAKEALLSGLRSTHDSPGAIEGYYATAALSGLMATPGEYMAAVESVTLEDVIQAAGSLHLHTTYVLKGVDE